MLKHAHKRDPDFIIEEYEFFFKEMIQFNSEDRIFYKLKCEGDSLFFYSNRIDMWMDYHEHIADKANSAYLNWYIEYTLLGEPWAT